MVGVPVSAIAAGTAAVLGMSAPGANSQSLKDAYVKKTVDASQIMTETKNDNIPMLDLRLKDHVTSLYGSRVIESTLRNWISLVVDHAEPYVEIGVTPPDPVFVGMRIRNLVTSTLFNVMGIDVQNFVSQFGGGDGSGFKTLFACDVLGSGGPGTGGFDYDDFGGTGTGTGAQIGPPTAAIGTRPNNAVLAGHRHAFSGRFYVGGFMKTPVIVGAPLKFARFKVLNNFTVRRISIYTLTAPIGNGETWGIVNAANATQGTAVALNGGVQENEAAQTTNLLGNTNYYLAQIGMAATAASIDANLEVEYTMNV